MTCQGCPSGVDRLLGALMRGGWLRDDLVYDAEGRVVVYADQEAASRTSAGLDYLRTLEIHFGGVAVESVVRFGDPVVEILDEAEAFGADLIVVGTAGRSGIGRVLLGSVAERVFAKAPVPVMLVRPTATVPS